MYNDRYLFLWADILDSDAPNMDQLLDKFNVNIKKVPQVRLMYQDMLYSAEQYGKYELSPEGLIDWLDNNVEDKQVSQTV